MVLQTFQINNHYEHHKELWAAFHAEKHAEKWTEPGERTIWWMILT
jgi:hypothetical protein